MSGLATQFVRRRVNVSARTLVDGKIRSSMPEYRIWTGMLARCSNPGSSAFYRYGARGISVCQRWRDDFENFYADMGPRPSPRHSIDRIDNDGNYEPGNCRWATPDVQAKNKAPVKAENCWTADEIETLTRMYREFYPIEEIAEAVKRSPQTTRLRAFMLGLRRDSSMTKMANRYPGLAHILREQGQSDFMRSVAEYEAARKQAAADMRAEAAAAVSNALMTLSIRRDIGRDEKIRLMRLAGGDLSAIGKVFGISRERVRQIQAKNFGLLNKPPRKVYKTKPENRQRHVNRLLRAWAKASEDARIEFLRVVSPVSDADEVAA